VRLLKQISLFQDVPRGELDGLTESLQPVSAPAGSLLIREGEPGDCLYMIESGKVGVFKGGIRIHELQSGEYFGEMAVLTQGARTATIAAETDVRLWKLDSGVFYERMIDMPGMAVEMMKLLSRRTRDALGSAGSEAGARDADLGEHEVAASAGDLSAAAAKQPAIRGYGTVGENGGTGDGQNVGGGGRSENGVGVDGVDSEDGTSGNAAVLKRVLVLQQVPLFQHLSAEGFLNLAQLVQEEAYAPGKTVCRTGEYGDTLYAVVDGAVSVRREGRTIATLGKGEYFGEMAIIDSGPRSADCIAVGHTSLLSLRKEQLLAFCFRDAETLRGMMRVLAERLQGIA